MPETTRKRPGRKPAVQPAAAGAFARAVRTGRIALGWTQEELSREAGLSTGSVNNLEMGRQKPSLHVALLLSRKLGFSLDALPQPEADR